MHSVIANSGLLTGPRSGKYYAAMASETEQQLQMAPRPPAVAPQPMWERSGRLETGLLGVVVLLYVSTLWFGFVYDDRGQILANPFIRSWRYFVHDFTANLWSQAARYYAAYYRPIFLGWLRLNYAGFGTSPWGWHLTSLLLHGLASVLVFRLALRLLRNTFQAAVAGVLFAVHPVHVESVAWVSGASDPLMSVFFLGALLCYLEWRESRSAGWMAASLLLAFLSMLTKEPGVTLPSVVFVYAWLFYDASPGAMTRAGGRFRAAITETAPFVIAALGYWALRVAALRVPPLVTTDSRTALLTLPGLLLFYLRLVVWPVGLSLFYDRQYVQHATFASFLLPLLILAMLPVVLAAWLRRSSQKREAAFATWLALVVLAPALWVRWFHSYDFVHDRYLYLPLAGFAILCAVGIVELGGKPTLGRIAPRRQVLPVAVIVMALVIGNVRLQTVWANDLLLWYHCFRSAPHNPVVLNNLASSLGERGEFRTAVPMFLEVLRDDPGNANAHGNLGYTYYLMGDLGQAEHHLSRAVQLDPTDAHWLLYLGSAHFKSGSLTAAQSDLSRAIALDPSLKGVHLVLSLVLEQRGDLAGAIGEAKAELANYPTEAPASQQLERLQNRR